MNSEGIFTSSDIDRIVRNFPLADIDHQIIKATHFLKVEGNPKVKYYWKELKSMLECARDVAEYCFMNDIPTIQPFPRKNVVDYRITKVLGAMNDLQGEITYTRNLLNTHITASKKDSYTIK